MTIPHKDPLLEKMNKPLKTNWTPYLRISTYFIILGLLGISILPLSFNDIECRLIITLQHFAQSFFGIPLFSIITYLGDFYLWSALSFVFFLYAYHKKSKKEFNLALQLGLYLLLISVSTYFLKIVFARPRPNCAPITVYGTESSLSYPSGHVSRATGAFIILLGRRSPFKVAVTLVAILLLALSRIILGVHYPTDTIGGVFLALAIQKVTTLTLTRTRSS
ncbi:MAG: phosphatase PAP2 family protein [Candidatus Bathyarchaeota archaeon]